MLILTRYDNFFAKKIASDFKAQSLQPRKGTLFIDFSQGRALSQCARRVRVQNSAVSGDRLGQHPVHPCGANDTLQGVLSVGF
jgi:hypothetical protein